MKAFAVEPRKSDSARVIDMPSLKPGQGEVSVRVLEVGICGTDAEINMGLYGTAPAGEKMLVLGHEALGCREDGSLVVPMVRRPCGDCSHCAQDSQDMCETDRFSEIGIKEAHGAIRETITESPDQLIPIPTAARSYAVLTEPMSVVAKGIRHTSLIQKRLTWNPKRALVLGAGPIGLLATLTLRTRGWSVMTVARRPPDSPKARVVRVAGGVYNSTQERPLPDLVGEEEPFDFIFEATGSADAAFAVMPALAVNGVLCLTSITGGGGRASVPIDKINYDLVLGNRLIFGTVNANRQDYLEGLNHMERIEREFPGLLETLITAKVSWDKVGDIFQLQKDGIKTVFSLES